MMTQSVNEKWLMSTLTISMFIFVVLLVPSALALEYEVGTQFGITAYTPPDGNDSDTLAILLILPTGDVGNIPASVYLTMYPHNHFGISPEISFGHFTNNYTLSGERKNVSESKLDLGCQFTYYLFKHNMSTPYLSARVATERFFSNEDDNTSRHRFGFGGGYQWRFAETYFLRAGGQFHRVLNEETHYNGYSVIMGLGVRFGGKQN